MFYPNPYCRLYTLGKSTDDILSRPDELFNSYIKKNYGYLTYDQTMDADDLEYIQDLQDVFMAGILELKELPDRIAIDSHY